MWHLHVKGVIWKIIFDSESSSISPEPPLNTGYSGNVCILKPPAPYTFRPTALIARHTNINPTSSLPPFQLRQNKDVPTLFRAIGDHGSPILPDVELVELGGLRDDETLLVGQMQQADEAEARRDVVHDGLGIHPLEIVHHIGELQRRFIVWFWCRRRCGLLVLCWW